MTTPHDELRRLCETAQETATNQHMSRTAARAVLQLLASHDALEKRCEEMRAAHNAQLPKAEWVTELYRLQDATARLESQRDTAIAEVERLRKERSQYVNEPFVSQHFYRAAIARAEQAERLENETARDRDDFIREAALLRDALDEACDLAEEGWEYAGEYFREKWDSAGRLNACHRQWRVRAAAGSAGAFTESELSTLRAQLAKVTAELDVESKRVNDALECHANAAEVWARSKAAFEAAVAVARAERAAAMRIVEAVSDASPDQPIGSVKVHTSSGARWLITEAADIRAGLWRPTKESSDE